MTRTTLHLFQDLATPHNNALIAAFRRQYPDVRLVTWYTMRTYKLLPWKESLADETDNAYADTWAGRWRALRAGVSSREPYLMVGYMKLTAKLIILLRTLLGRELYYWSDHPTEARSAAQRLLRRLAYGIIRRGARKVFVAGERTKDYFVPYGFRREELVNLPIFVDVPPPAAQDGQPIRDRYGVADGQRLAVAASRLDYAKGYDLLLEALAMLSGAEKAKLRVVIVGSGPEADNLRRMTEEKRLQDVVRFEPWLEPGEYQRVVAAADFFLHAARFDAFGGGTLFAMVAGVPVVGSDGAGSALDRIVDGRNGFLYRRESPADLAEAIRRMLADDAARREMGRNARRTAEEWPPERGARIIYDTVYGRAS
jgi:glycosyltransferase involved in cell wall biosynthesis